MSRLFGLFFYLLIFLSSSQYLAALTTSGNDVLTIKNSKISFTVKLTESRIQKEIIKTTENWAKENNSSVSEYYLDGNFSFEIFWTYWNAPGKVNNSDLQLVLTKNDFHITNYRTSSDKNGAQSIIVDEKSPGYNFILRVEYLLKKNAFFVKKRMTISDSEYGTHFLEKVFAVKSSISGLKSVVKNGGYGQPAGFTVENGGGFVGVEFPTATTELDSLHNKISTVETIGKKITSSGVSSSWTVIGITPKPNVKFWFMKYLNSVRVVKLKPYTLYNSWYDLRSVEFPNVPSKFWMNEKNVFRIIDEIKSNFVEKHGIKIDAFVLDDGWDVYESDWKLRKKQFPHGMRPVAEKLKEINSTLGMWFGPTGGYSFRMKRINWMKTHGYEVVGAHGNWQPMLCIAGKNYKKLFTKRVTDFIKNAEVGYYKWDGIQFSCSEPNHGHPVGEYSRRAVMESVANICDTVRKLNPDIFLNITSGTWLSPWWIKYANTIWMQGGDYGYSDVPSISSRDRAITYRDITLYNDFRKNNLWFPISNLMTHGIIKGELQKLGGESEPIDKFTDNAVLYFARGVAMYELYISPDILSNDEWNALAQSLKWGKDNFDILMNTEMVGGNPSKGETYGYLHFNGNNGIVAVRNPKIEKDTINFTLSSEYGISEKLGNLVMEQIYPRNIFSDKLYKCGDKVSVVLNGFETAIFNFYPLDKADKPVISNVDFIRQSDDEYLLSPTGKRILNFSGKEKNELICNSKSLSIDSLIVKLNKIHSGENSTAAVKKIIPNEFLISYKLNENAASGELAILFTPNINTGGKINVPDISVLSNGKKIKSKEETEKGKWQWNIFNISKSENKLKVRIKGKSGLSGEMEIYLISFEKPIGEKVQFVKSNKAKIYPPRPIPDGIIKKENLIKKIRIEL